MTENTRMGPENPDEVVVAEIVEGPTDPHSLGIELPRDPEEAIDILLRALSEARSEASTYLDDLKRLAADTENLRKRMIRDHATNIERASQRVVEGLLPTLDSFDAALAIVPATEAEEKMLQGLRRTHTQLLETLGREGLEIIPAVGEPFDPAVHEAAIAPTEGDGRLVVKAEIRRGYQLKDHLLRAAVVALEYENGDREPAEDA